MPIPLAACGGRLMVCLRRAGGAMGEAESWRAPAFIQMLFLQCRFCLNTFYIKPA